jgi:hypothetical protein
VQCDTPPGQADYFEEAPRLTNFRILPDRVDFDRGIGAVDTTLIIQLSVDLGEGFSSSAPPNYKMIDNSNGAVIRESTFSQFNEATRRWSHIVSLATTTTVVKDYTIHAWISSENETILSKAQGTFSIFGFSTSPPEILWVDNPDSVRIPDAGTVDFSFFANVVHPDGQSNISEVLLALSDGSGNALTGSPFEMFDDGRLEDSGDLVAGDSVFTRRFSIGPGNQPDNLTVRYYALDRFGVSSDTLTSSLTIWR